MAAIIFDFDGTIADSFDYVSDFLAGQAGLAPLNKEQKQRLRGLSVAGMVRKLGYHWWNAPELFFKGRWRMRHAIKHLHPFEGMPEVIAKLHAEGHELFILSTNSISNIHQFLHQHKLHTYFLEIYGGVGMFGKAPALRRLLREQNIDVADAFYIGDELGDVQAAHSIGLHVIAVTWGFARRRTLEAADTIGLADDPVDIIRILEEL
jgi:phosphoglycolate phosphatase